MILSVAPTFLMEDASASVCHYHVLVSDTSDRGI